MVEAEVRRRREALRGSKPVQPARAGLSGWNGAEHFLLRRRIGRGLRGRWKVGIKRLEELKSQEISSIRPSDSE